MAITTKSISTEAPMRNLTKNTRNTATKPYKYGKWVLITIVSIVLLALAYYKLKPTEEIPNYITATVSKGNIENSVMASGKVKAINTVNVGAQVSGEVTELYVNVGDVVKKGDLIAQIDEVTQRNQLSNSQASLIQSKASLASALSTFKSKQANLTTATANLKKAEANQIKAKSDLTKFQVYLQRLEPLLDINAISKQDYDNAKADVITAQANLDSTQASIKTALADITSAKANLESGRADIASQQANLNKSQTNVNSAQKNLRYTTIRAPMDGTVVSISTEEGSTVNANQSAPTIVTLADLSRVRINAQISEADVIKVKAGLPVYFNTIGNPDDKIEATLAGIEPAPENISTNSSTNSAIYYIGYVEAPNPKGRFRIDMTAQVYIIIDQAKDVLTIPSSAIKADGKTDKKPKDKSANIQRVKVLQSDGTTVKDKEVTIGINNRVDAQVISGLDEGDKIIISEGNNGKESENNRKGQPRF